MRHSLCSPLMRRTENMSCSRAVIFPSGFSCDAKKCSFPPFRLKHADRSFYEDSHKMTKEVGCDKQGLKAKRPSSLLFPPSLPSFQSQGPSTCDVCPTFRRPFASRAARRRRRQIPSAAAAAGGGRQSLYFNGFPLTSFCSLHILQGCPKIIPLFASSMAYFFGHAFDLSLDGLRLEAYDHNQE